MPPVMSRESVRFLLYSIVSFVGYSTIINYRIFYSMGQELNRKKMGGG